MATERSRVRRTKDKAVRHGDVIHIYVASDTPPAVCDYLTALKQRGDFSFEILRMVEDFLRRTGQLEDEGTNLPESNLRDRAKSEPADAHASRPIGGAHRETGGKVTIPELEPPLDTNAPHAPASTTAPNPVELLRRQRKAWVNKTQDT